MIQSLILELSSEKDNTLRILNNLKESEFAYKPHPKSMSLGELANHIVELHNWVNIALTKSVFNFHTDYQPSALSSVEELKNVLEDGYIKNKQVLSDLTEESLNSIWKLTAGDHVIAEMPKFAALRFIINNHLIHHRGQITVYMRLLDIPVPGIYGPSADDKA